MQKAKTETQGEICKITIIEDYFNPFLSMTNRSGRQNISKGIDDLKAQLTSLNFWTHTDPSIQ